jgi:hypothetical protein
MKTRTRIWVDPFQTQLFYRVTLYWSVFTFTVFNLLFAWRLLVEGPGDLWQQFVATVYDNIPLLVSFIILAPWIGLDAVRFANRLVGPLYRFRKTMQSVTANELVQPIRLRKDDFLMGMQEDLNLMLEALERRNAVQLERAEEATAKVGD